MKAHAPFSQGFTLIELLVVISIIGLLASIVIVSLSSARAKGRYAQVIEQMTQIRNAAELANTGSYAPDVGGNTMPSSFVGSLSSWPTPPCTGWAYDWENWSAGGQIYITVRNASGASVVYMCLYDTVLGCGLTADGANIQTNWPSKQFTCSE